MLFGTWMNNQVPTRQALPEDFCMYSDISNNTLKYVKPPCLNLCKGHVLISLKACQKPLVGLKFIRNSKSPRSLSDQEGGE